MNKKNIDYKLYLVTDRTLLGKKDLYDSIKNAILGGTTIIQLREKSISSLEFYEIGKKIKEITKEYNVPLIINDRLDIALAVDADGLHIGQRDLPLEIARKILGPEKIIGLSTATLEEAKIAQSKGADYVGVGAVFSTSTKNNTRSVSLETLRKIKDTLDIPVIGIGGINERNVKEVIKVGIDGVAVVSAILGKENIKEASTNLLNLINGELKR